MQNLQVFSRNIGSELYQVFIKNEAHDWDFARAVSFNSFRNDQNKPKYVRDWLIISPDKTITDDHFIDESTKSELQAMTFTYLIATSHRKPSHRIASYDVKAPSHSSLPKTIRASIVFAVAKRSDDSPLKVVVEQSRLNIKDQIHRLVAQYTALRHSVSFEQILKAGERDTAIGQDTLQQIKLLDYSEPYNMDMTFKQAYDKMGAQFSRYYTWFVADFELDEPNGSPPENEVKLPIHFEPKGDL